jgi:immunoglobulin-binding protein 1
VQAAEAARKMRGNFGRHLYYNRRPRIDFIMSESNNSSSVAARFREASSLIQTSPQDAVEKLESIQADVAAVALFSTNETIDDVSTPSLPLLSLDHHLAIAYAAIPTVNAKERKRNVLAAMDHFSRFLEQLGQLEVLPDDRRRDYEMLLQINLEEPSTFPLVNRDEKIQRFRSKQELQQQLDQLQSVKDRRSRLGLREDEEMDGYDDDSLERTLALKALTLHATEAIEEWQQGIREMPMIEMQLKMEEQRQGDPRRASTQEGPVQSNQGLQLTHITKDSMTGQLNIRKEEIRSQVFRPGWNQPTMSLEELGDREVQEAVAREERQKVMEEQHKLDPRRYDQLVKDEMEDVADLVDASAAIDRAWDDWRAENPTGSGNKMGDRGDRNF